MSGALQPALALVLTPTILCISTSNSLYLQNQHHLGLQTSVLLPYVYLFLGIYVLGIFTYQMARWVQLPLALYYLWGPAYLVYDMLSSVLSFDMSDTTLALSVPLLWLAGSLMFIRHGGLASARSFFAVVGTGILLYEALLFYRTREPMTTAYAASETSSALLAQFEVEPNELRPADRPHSDLPNVYHLLFDGFQTDGFEIAVPPAVREDELRGFTFYSDATTVYDRTRMSVPSIFLGTMMDCAVPHERFKSAQFTSNQSLLFGLVQQGYRTYRFYAWEARHSLPVDLFDYSIDMQRFGGGPGTDQTQTYFDLWLVANTPGFVARRFMNTLEYERLASVESAPHRYQLDSVAGFRKFLEFEEHLSATGRYTFVHILVPHRPFVLDADCFTREKREDAEAVRDQYLCAGKLFREFVAELKRLDRYENSLILVHADHGASFTLVDGKLIPLLTGNSSGADIRYPSGPVAEAVHRARVRSLLLIKRPFLNGDLDRFVTSDAPAMLTDIAPTIFDGLNIEPAAEYAGWSLIHPENLPKHRERTYHVVNDGGGLRFLKGLEEYTISGNSSTLSRASGDPLAGCPEG